MPGADPLIQIKPTDGEARIFIDCNRKADKPINQNLFGKFTEHLGRNIYNGMWAQILENTSFADWSFFSRIWTPEADHLRDPDIERHRQIRLRKGYRLPMAALRLRRCDLPH